MKKLAAGALQLVTFIGVIIALLLATFLVLIHGHKQFKIKTSHTIETTALIDKAMHQLLDEETVFFDSLSPSLADSDYKSIKIHKSYWGGFQKGYASAAIKHTKLEKLALLGGHFQNTTPTALYLKDNNKPLVLVGDTKIEGRAYLPQRGVKSGNIAGHSYYGDKFIYGETSLSQRFPALTSEHMAYLEQLSKGNNIDVKPHDYISLKASKGYQNSFKNSLKLVYSEDAIYLADVKLSGHIIVKSETKITVHQSAQLNDVILIAPIIEIKSKVKGRFQSVATEKLFVETDVNLNYPSSLVLIRDYDTENLQPHHMIFIADNSVVKGNVIMLGKTSPSNYKPQIRINPSAIIKGMVYCEQNLELRGTVYGTVVTNNFVIQEAGSNYQNHLYNAKINAFDLEDQFIGLPLEQTKSGIAKWLY